MLSKQSYVAVDEAITVERGNKPAWPYPVVANGRLYLRDMDALLCYEIKAAKGSGRCRSYHGRWSRPTA